MRRKKSASTSESGVDNKIEKPEYIEKGPTSSALKTDTSPKWDKKPRGSRPEKAVPDSKTDPQVLLERLNSEIIPHGFGVTLPKFRGASVASDDMYMPLGIVHGTFEPLGQDNISEAYPRDANMWSNRAVTKLRLMYKDQSFVSGDIKIYINSVSKLIQMQRFVYELLRLQAFAFVHTSRPVNAILDYAISGRLVKHYERLTKLLASCPYPPAFLEAFLNGFEMTTTSESPFGPIRMFAPADVQPADDSRYEAARIDLALNNAITAFQTNGENASLVSLLPWPTVTLPMYPETYVRYKNDTVNNILNLPYVGIQGTHPDAGDLEAVSLYFRGRLSEHSFYTFSTDDSVVTTPQTTVWRLNATTASATSALVAVDNVGNTSDVYSSPELFRMFGSVWEQGLLTFTGAHPSTSVVRTTFDAVSTAIGSRLLVD
jgi:hypothetical protein